MLPCLCSAPLFTAEARPQENSQDFLAGVELVTVDVVVASADGTPVVGLTKDDFEVQEDGEPQVVARFTAIELPAEPDGIPRPQPAVSSNTGDDERAARSFALIFDDLHLAPTQTRRARDVIAGFLARNLREGDRALLATTSGGAWWSARMEAGRERLLDLLETLEGQRLLQGSAKERMSDYEAIRIIQHQDLDVCKRVLRRFVSEGALPIPRIDGPIVSIYCNPTVARSAQEAYDRETQRTRATFAALTRAMEGLAAIGGRKSVVLVSTGFVLDQEIDERRDVVAASRRANAAVYFVDVRGLEVGMEQLFQAHYENPDTFGSADIPQPPAASQLTEDWLETEGAVTLASDTGGFSVRNSNDLARGIARIADESRVYYLLGYTPTKTARDGKFRKIEVRVDRKGVKVRARRGYYATAAQENTREADELPLQMQRALQAPLEVAGIGLRASASVFEEGEPGHARVEWVADIALGDVSFDEREGRQVAAVDTLLRVARLMGGEPESLSETINLRLRPETYERAQFYPYRKTLSLKPGHYQARFLAHDRANGTVGSVVHDFDVPELDGLRVASPVLTDTASPAIAGQPPEPMLVPYRDFPSTGMLLCSVEVYGAASDPASGEPRVLMSYSLRHDGREVAGEEARPMAPGPNGALGGAIGLSLADLAPGTYDLALEFVDDVRGQRQRLHELFTVVAAPLG